MDSQWLLPLIQAKFYGKCQCGGNNSNYFCIECLGLPFCGECYKRTKEHEGQQVLQVFRVSHREGINSVVLERLLDISDIQRYIINAKTIVYIQRRQSEARKNCKRGKGHKGCNECEICGWPSVTSPSKFCSIECKVDFSRKKEKTRTGVTEEETSIDEAKRSFELPTPAGSKRNIHRKGIPTRSPLL